MKLRLEVDHYTEANRVFVRFWLHNSSVGVLTFRTLPAFGEHVSEWDAVRQTLQLTFETTVEDVQHFADGLSQETIQ